MHIVVSYSQCAFFRRRQIIDGILVANEMVDGRKKSKRSGVACKIDMEKAYDKVDWDFVR